MNNKTIINKATVDLGYSPDALAQRQAELLAYIRQTVPEVIADNQIDVEKLKELLGHDRIAPDEHYELNWAGKSAARREIQKTSSLTLRPDPNNPPSAQHMLIEGENLEVLRVLQKSYYGKVKMIYIDPPYNTGSDSFVYPDDYSESLEDYLRRTGEKNEAGYLNKQSLWKKNSKESGHYHSAWLSMMYPRLYLARNLLQQDGVIFISIDDNEVANLKLLCDEVYGAENFEGHIHWRRRHNQPNDKTKMIGLVAEHILCYAKNSSDYKTSGVGKIDLTGDFSNPDNDPRGDWASKPWKVGSDQSGSRYSIKNPNSGIVFDEEWMGEKETYLKLLADNRIIFPRRGDGLPRKKYFRYEREEEGQCATNWWSHEDFGHNQGANDSMTALFDVKNIFSNPKPIKLIRGLLQIANADKSALILDFFAGSGTTAHAVMELNLEDGGTRQCISVQMPEVLDENCEAYKAGYRTISEITRARIDKVIAKLKAEHPGKTRDLACAQFALAPSSFKVWRGDLNDERALREQLSMFQSAEKTGRGQPVDDQIAMLTELLLKHGLGALGVHAISKPRQVAGVTVYRVLMADDKHMWLCFETYTDALKDEIVKAMPAQVMMLNSCFVGPKADEQLANLQLELAGLDIGLTVI
jgi:adenine-specific DNA-methyltransferase